MEQTKRIVIGLVGFGSVGKDTIARYLIEKYHFVHVSSGDLIRAYVKEHHLGEPTRSVLQKVANELREKNGADYLTVTALENPAPRLIISGLRAIPEVEKVKQEGGIVIAVTAPIETRYAWAHVRGGAKDHVTFEEFKAIEEKEAQSNSVATQNIKGVLEKADITLVNKGSLEDLFGLVDKAMIQIVK